MSFDSPSKARHVARRCLVAGRVQGVYYRASAQQRARAAGIAGYARNLEDGRVEVLAYGEESARAYEDARRRWPAVRVVPVGSG